MSQDRDNSLLPVYQPRNAVNPLPPVPRRDTLPALTAHEGQRVIVDVDLLTRPLSLSEIYRMPIGSSKPVLDGARVLAAGPSRVYGTVLAGRGSDNRQMVPASASTANNRVDDDGNQDFVTDSGAEQTASATAERPPSGLIVAVLLGVVIWVMLHLHY